MNSSEKVAVNAALRLLSRQSYASARLEAKLCEKGHSQEAAAAAAAFCAERGYIDDEAFARRLIEKQAERGYGERRISAYLQSKGISRGLTEVLVEEWEERISSEERNEALQALCRKLHRGESWDIKEKNRVSNALARRGFGWDAIKEALREVCED